ncbi:YceD family protein [Sunxiuqinia sp. sy24]|uniref:YceD family protein n=1 Tax=Sunxiuqinia sp. sy24 TaxID=3461495 RepID=UPI0040461CEA
MANLKAYNVALKGLGLGKHQFDYQIGRKFFEYFDGGIAEDGRVDVKLELEKQSGLIVLWFHVSGTVKIHCDRCLDLFDQPVESQNEVFVKYGEEKFEEGDDVIWVAPDDSHINMAKLIYDFIVLSIPIKHVHPDDANGESLCNPEMLAKLNLLSVKDVEEDEEPETDTRWDELKKLLE